MRVKPRSYPHPVLSTFGDDIVGSQLQITVAVKGTKSAYVVDVRAKTSNADLAALIGSGDAQYAVHVECPLTRFRALFSSATEQFTFEIPSSDVDGSVEVCSFVLATKDIGSYSDKGFHPDYKGVKFTVRPGDTLAVYADQSFEAEKKIDPLRKIPSIFVVIQADDPDAPPMDLNLMTNKVTVSLSKPNYEAYQALRNDQNLHSVLNAMVIIPALVAVLEAVKKAAADSDELATLRSRRWFGVLARRLKEVGVDPELPSSFGAHSTPALANKLIGQPLNESLSTLRGYGDDASHD